MFIFFPFVDNVSVSAFQAFIRAESVWGALRGTVCLINVDFS